MLNTKMMKMMQLCGTVAVILAANLAVVEAMEERAEDGAVTPETGTTAMPDAMNPLLQEEVKCINSDDEKYSRVCYSQPATYKYENWKPKFEPDEEGAEGQCKACRYAIFCVNYGKLRCYRGRESICKASSSNETYFSTTKDKLFGWTRNGRSKSFGILMKNDDKWMCQFCANPDKFVYGRWARFKNASDPRNPVWKHVGLVIRKGENDYSQKEVTAEFVALQSERKDQSEETELKKNTKVTFWGIAENGYSLTHVVVTTDDGQKHTVKIEEWTDAKLFRPLNLGNVTLIGKDGTTCSNCNGKGKTGWTKSWSKCETCDGTGTVTCNIVVSNDELIALKYRYNEYPCSTCATYDKDGRKNPKGTGKVKKWNMYYTGYKTVDCTDCHATGNVYPTHDYNHFQYY